MSTPNYISDDLCETLLEYLDRKVIANIVDPTTYYLSYTNLMIKETNNSLINVDLKIGGKYLVNSSVRKVIPIGLLDECNIPFTMRIDEVGAMNDSGIIYSISLGVRNLCNGMDFVITLQFRYCKLDSIYYIPSRGIYRGTIKYIHKIVPIE